MSDYRKALDLDEDFQRAKEGMQTAQKRQKQASKRDYYKILGVKRNAGKKEINKAYRCVRVSTFSDFKSGCDFGESREYAWRVKLTDECDFLSPFAENLPRNGIPTTSWMRMKRRQQKRSLWTLLQQKKSCQMTVRKS